MQISTDNMIYSPSMNLVDIVVDEIALEGMDGITLEALWSRLSIRLDCKLPLSEFFMEQIWKICLSVKDLKFYELQNERDKLVIFDRYKYVDEDLGTIQEPDDVPDDIYLHCPIDDVTNGQKGSCMDYDKRKLIDNIKNIQLNNALNDYGNKLIIVASQNLRENALMGDCVCPTIDLNIKQYCFLERIGRSRYHGEVTQGKRSLVILGEEPKTLFYHRKVLTKYKLITKQLHHQKSSTHSTPGSLLHLIRFYVERKPKMIYLAEKIVDILKNSNNYMIDMQELKTQLQMHNSIRKLMKMSFFRKVVTTINERYRNIYPNAKEIEWKRKGCDKEKYIYAFKLIDPNVDINDLWYDNDTYEDDEYYELDISSQCINQPLLTQANLAVESTTCNGISQTDLSKKMGLTRLVSRTMFRNLEKIGLVGTYIDDIGRQKTTKYLSRKYEKNSELSKQLLVERNKMLEYKKISMAFNNNDDTTTAIIIDNTQNIEDNNVIEIDNTTTTATTTSTTNESNNVNLIKRHNLFLNVNKILKKYKLNNYMKNYKITYENLIEKNNNDELLMKKNDNFNISIEENILLSNINSNYRYFKKFINEKNNIKKRTISTKKITRKNIILETLEKCKIIDTFKMLNVINDKEPGTSTRIDKKSLFRLLDEMQHDKLIKNIKLTLTSIDNSKIKLRLLICHVSVNINDQLFQSIIDDAQLKFTHPVTCSKKLRNNKLCRPKLTIKKTTKIRKKLNEKIALKQKIIEPSKIATVATAAPSSMIPNPRAGYKYGRKPKFARMKVLHLFLYYRIFEHNNMSTNKNITREEKLNILSQCNSKINITNNMIDEMPEIYNTDGDWKMFIPPLSCKKNSPIGWISMTDIIYHMPLSLCLNIYNMRYVIPDLDDYFNHPIRKNYLIKDLPLPIRRALMIDKKYITALHETIQLLCFIGLVQFGPHHYKKKDEVEIYVNRKSQLMNTIETSPNYYQIDKNKNYPIENYTFDTMQIVEEYWHRMHFICINTPLGSRLNDEGKEIVFEELNKKNNMIELLKPIIYKDAEVKDNGIMPGDKLGASGIDSAFFSHLKRNWDIGFVNQNNNLTNNDDTCYERKRYLSNIKVKPIKFIDLSGIKKISGPTNLTANELKDETKKKNTNNNNNNKNDKININIIEEQLKDEFLNNSNNNLNKEKRNCTYVRKILPRRNKKKRRVKYDDIDNSALQKMNKLRVDWSSREDNILLVCKVVMMFLCPNPRRQIITFTLVRDVLRLYSSKKSQNKTSRACQRRLLFMLKQPRTVHSVSLGVEELKQNHFITSKYGDVITKIKKIINIDERDEKCAEIFKELVAYVAKKYYDISHKKIKNNLHNINTIQEFNLLYEICDSSQKIQNIRNQQYDIKSLHDIYLSTLNSVIYSSMNCENHTSWAYQLCKIYKQYPEYLLRNAITKIRTQQMISVKKTYETIVKKRGNFMPLSSNQYQFSIAYNYKFYMKLPDYIFNDVFSFFKNIINSYKTMTNNNSINDGVLINSSTNSGMVFSIYESLLNNLINFNINIPDHIITLDPNCSEYDDETFARISKRYQDILASLEQLKFERNTNTNNDNNDADIMEIENDNSNNNEKVKNDNEIDSNTDKQKTNKKSVNTKASSWTVAHLKSLLFDETINSQIDNNSTVNNERKYDNFLNDKTMDIEYLRLQDGTVIEITKDDVKNEKSLLLDDDMYDIFLNAREKDDYKECYNDRMAIDRLMAIVDEPETMEIETSNQQVEENIQTNLSDNQISQKQTETIDINNDDSIKNNNININKNSEIINNKNNDTNDDNKKKYTRIALLKMREELTDLPNNNYAHDYFHVNAFDIYYKLPQLDNELLNNSELIIDNKLTSKLLMFDDNNDKIITSDFNDNILYPTDPIDIDEIKNLIIDKYDIDENNINDIINFVENKHEQGATLKQLTINYYKLIGNKLYKILLFLCKKKLFLRTGVTVTRYIHKKYTDPWIIKSVRIKRLQRENLPPIPQSSIYLFSNSKLNKDDPTINQDKMEIDNEQSTSSKSNTYNTADEKKTIMKIGDVEKAVQTLDSNTTENVNVIIRPWIKVDGQINNSVFEKMLGSVLSYCSMNPGVYMTKVQDKFSPALQYYHTRELIEFLVKLNCLKLTILKKEASTLFSKSEFSRLKYPLENDGSSEFEADIIIDTTICSIIKFSSFLRENKSQLQL
ncbi:hypothetical protein HCN44_001155 [Aphidius gifuensis]|uniref:B-block binding subunit of TFIIIC domain-containing protein n=1 Tax=Aphidius gifuensis TaxID=684658 RepID=A0A834XN63_APHGI|nr:general transcription factor 3C polypeptide 1-like [Aphidius gifuensis]KAF7988582.1 hypothetical protein HCN44_001155 [Aphidius gifuensis]